LTFAATLASCGAQNRASTSADGLSPPLAARRSPWHLLIGAMLLSLGGTAGSTFATEETGSLYDVGGYRLYLQCSGRVGGPGEQSRRRQDHAGYAEARTG
jgi:hypothetical protein